LTQFLAEEKFFKNKKPERIIIKKNPKRILLKVFIRIIIYQTKIILSKFQLLSEAANQECRLVFLLPV
jgi:hypothetical protein